MPREIIRDKEEDYLYTLNENNISDIAKAFNDELCKHVFTDDHSGSRKTASFEVVSRSLFLRVANADDYYVYSVMQIPYGTEFVQPNDAISISSPKQIASFLREKQIVSLIWPDNNVVCCLDVSLSSGIRYTESSRNSFDVDIDFVLA